MTPALVAARVVVAVVGAALVALVLVAGTASRDLVAYARVDGQLVQVPISCSSLLSGGADGRVTGPGTPVDELPEGESLLQDPANGCPGEGVVWQGVVVVTAGLVVGATVWAWIALGRRLGPPVPVT